MTPPARKPLIEHHPHDVEWMRRVQEDHAERLREEHEIEQAERAVCPTCGDEKILTEPDGSNAQPCYACQPAGTTLEQAARPYEGRP